VQEFPVEIGKKRGWSTSDC